MGRPLKIQKYSNGSSVSGGAVAVDQSYPPFSALTNAVYPTTMTSSNTFGVVGGVRGGAVSATYPVIKVEAYIANSYTGQAPALILRQKGSHKYLVATNAAIDPANAVAGVAVRIVSVGDTDWAAMGLTGTAAVGTIFTPTAASAGGTTGTCNEVGVCILSSDLTPPSGYMSISYAIGGDSTEVAVSRLTNKFLSNWTNFQTKGGTSLTEYVGNNNVGEVLYSGESTYVANFFTDVAASDTAKSGADAPTFANTTGDMDLAQVEKYTS